MLLEFSATSRSPALLFFCSISISFQLQTDSYFSSCSTFVLCIWYHQVWLSKFHLTRAERHDTRWNTSWRLMLRRRHVAQVLATQTASETPEHSGVGWGSKSTQGKTGIWIQKVEYYLHKVTLEMIGKAPKTVNLFSSLLLQIKKNPKLNLSGRKMFLKWKTRSQNWKTHQSAAT